MRDITRIVGVKRTALQQWIDRGFIAPSIEKASGHGTRNVWSQQDLFRIAVFQELLANGFTREEAAEVVNSKETVVISERGVELPGKGVPDIRVGIMVGSATYAYRIEKTDGTVMNRLVVVMDGYAWADALPKFVRHEKIENVRSIRIVNLMESAQKALG